MAGDMPAEARCQQDRGINKRKLFNKSDNYLDNFRYSRTSLTTVSRCVEIRIIKLFGVIGVLRKGVPPGRGIAYSTMIVLKGSIAFLSDYAVNEHYQNAILMQNRPVANTSSVSCRSLLLLTSHHFPTQVQNAHSMPSLNGSITC